MRMAIAALLIGLLAAGGARRVNAQTHSATGGTVVIGGASAAASANPIASVATPNLGLTALATRHDVLFVIAGDSLLSGVPGAGTLGFDVFFAQTPVGKAWGVGANGASNIINCAVAGTGIGQVYNNYATCGHQYRPGVTYNGATITTVYYYVTEEWNSEGADSATNVPGEEQLYQQGWADGDIVIGATVPFDSSEAHDGKTEAGRYAFDTQIRQLGYAGAIETGSCVSTGLCPPKLLNDVSAMADAIATPIYSYFGGTADSYLKVWEGTDSRHPANAFSQAAAFALSSLISSGRNPYPVLIPDWPARYWYVDLIQQNGNVATQNIVMGFGPKQQITLAQNTAFTVSDLRVDDLDFQICQPATGTSTYTVTFPSAMHVPASVVTTINGMSVNTCAALAFRSWNAATLQLTGDKEGLAP